MAGVCCALGSDGAYIYITPTSYKWDKIGTELENYLKEHDPQKLLWAAYGPEKSNYFISYIDKDGSHRIVYDADDTPKALIDWVVQGYDQQLRVSLGPNGSFFAWTSDRIRWQNLPPGLEKAIQGWLGPTGWTSGPPRLVSLGPDGSYFALSEYGACAWSFPDALIAKHPCFKTLDDEIEKERPNLEIFEVMSLSTAQPGHHICIKKNLWFTGFLDEWEPFESSMDTMVSEDEAKTRRQKREAERKKKAEDEEAQGKKQREEEEEAARRREQQERIRRQREENELAEELALQFYLWKTGWDDTLSKKRVLTTFPHFPVQILFCEEISCKIFKEEPDSLRACRHDVERLFRASGMYSHAWLKKERLGWHPDRFGQRCDPDYRKALKKKSEQLYQIMEQLMAQEVGDDDAWEDIP